MQILFVHQNFPGQYLHLVRALAQQGQHRLIALSIQTTQEDLPANLQVFHYTLKRGNAHEIHPLLMDLESKIIRAEACAEAASRLKHQGFTPDLICAHPGWGESLYLKEIWPDTPILNYQEFFYNSTGFDSGFDPEFNRSTAWEKDAEMITKNTHLFLALEQADWNITPTQFQQSSFPSRYHARFSVIHDGVDTRKAAPSERRLELRLPDGCSLASGMPVVTFVNRSIEPHRGCHTFIRALPALFRLIPEAQVVIIGDANGIGYGPRCTQGTWLDCFLKEIEGSYNPDNLHICGYLSHEHYLALLKLSACHVYLTYPFVLSWSLLESMSCGCPVIGSATEPVMELIQDGNNGLLVDFFSPNDLASSMAEMLKHPQRFIQMCRKARETIADHYSLEACLPRQIALLGMVASGALMKT